MDRLNILILTSTFPFPPDEAFLEDEIPYLGETTLFAQVTLMPFSAKGQARSIPSKVKIDTSLSEAKIDTSLSKAIQNKRILRCLFHYAQAVFQPFFYKELAFLIKQHKVNLLNLKIALSFASTSLQVFKFLRKYLKRNKISCVYSYWNEAVSYGAALAKEAGFIDVVVTRAHSSDFYEYRRPNNYMPLKRQFSRSFNGVFVLSESARRYINDTYDIPLDLIRVSPLGVPIPEKASTPSQKGTLNIVSVSLCVPLKRIDKIINAIAVFAESNNSIQINWDHIGDGPLLQDLSELAREKLSRQKNVTYFFHGKLSNTNVKQFYFNKYVDIFINTSESEGIPVSIMEAMAAGVLPIAPDVGGIADLVSNDFGVLLNENPSIEEIATAINELSKISKDTSVRALARNKIKTRFNSAKNYSTFYETLYTMTLKSLDPANNADYQSQETPLK